MHISRVIVQNYRCLNNFVTELNQALNIIVGDNECGKSTFLEAVNAALTGQLSYRPIQSELHPHLFSASAVVEYLKLLRDSKPAKPPVILIEVYFSDDPDLSEMKGRNNSRREDVPGVKLLIELNEAFKSEYDAYISKPEDIRAVPVEYYIVRWRNFADNDIATSRSIPFKPTFIDASLIRNNLAASRYVIEIIKNGLSKNQQVELALAYRRTKDQFLDDPNVSAINKNLASKRGQISDKVLTVALDSSARANWESGIMPHLDDIPVPFVGKGEQNSVNIKLAMDNSSKAQLLLIEEIENHLSFSNLNVLVSHVKAKRGERQILVTTHSSFVLNKLGVESVLMLSNGVATTFKSLEPGTQDYFARLPGYDTLRLILSKRAILVEGPSDELIVQKAFHLKHGKMPLEKAVDVITVGSLAFKRFLDIARLLQVKVDVVTDNDGNVSRLKEKYQQFSSLPLIRILFDDDESAPTLEPQLVRKNGRTLVNKILGKDYTDEEKLLEYMRRNKTECALKFFETSLPWEVPEYIARACE